MCLRDAELAEEVFERPGPHRRARISVDRVGDPVTAERVLEHFDSEVVDLAFLDAAGDKLAGDVDDRVRLERDPAPRGAQVGDVPAPYLSGTGRFQHGHRAWCPVAVATPSGRDGAGGLVLDLGRDAPPRAA